MDNIKIRKAKIEDIKNVVPVLMRAWKFAYDGIMDAEFLKKRTSPENYSDRVKVWEQRFEKEGSEIFLVAEIKEKIIGFAVGGASKKHSEADSEIAAFYVDPDYQGIGVGRKLFNAFVDIARLKGSTTMVIGCLSENKSIGFYKKMGGKILKEAFWEYEKGKLSETFFIFDTSFK